LVFTLYLLALATGESQTCCKEKNVGGIRYTYIGSDDSGVTSAKKCLSPCMYKKDGGSSDKVYCFKQGNEEVECLGESGSLGPASKKKLCETKGCIKAANSILERMDSTVNPCTDFFNFACGGFIKNTNIPDDKIQVESYGTVGDTVNLQIKGLLQEKIKDDDPKPFKMAKSFYHSCMNNTILEKVGVTGLKAKLTEVGGWPLLEGEAWSEEGFKWYETTYKLRNAGYGHDYMIGLYPGVDVKDNRRQLLQLSGPKLSLPRELLMKERSDPALTAYFQYMKDAALLLGVEPTKIDEELEKILQFEISLAKLTPSKEETRNATKLYNPMKISEVSKLDSNTPWLEYTNKILKTVQVTEEETIIVNYPAFVSSLSKLITDTPARVQQNWLMWKVVFGSLAYLNKEADEINQKFVAKLSGQSSAKARWASCVEKTTENLEIAVGSFYVNNYFNDESKTAADEMISDIRKQLLIVLDNASWIDDKTKSRAREKANAMGEHIGYPSELKDMTKIEEYYSSLQISPTDYLGNILNVNIFNSDKFFKELKKNVDKNNWIVSAAGVTKVDAWYSRTTNSITFPAGVLQGIFFSAERPKYMNYGAVGAIMGHEITHGFDDQGSQFDKDGNLVNWWEPATLDKYLEKAKCIINQYSKYTVKELDNTQLNGIITQGENIADNGGTLQAYKAYEAWVENNLEEPLLPGLNYTQKQLFWISLGNTWCAKYSPQALQMQLLDVHSPSQFRVKGPLSNMDEFAKDFNCPVGSAMNPEKEKKCKVW